MVLGPTPPLLPKQIIDGGGFVLSQSSDYSSMSNSKKYKSSYSLSRKINDKFSDSSDCRGGAGPTGGFDGALP